MEGNDETALMAHTMLTLIVLRKKDLDERKRQISRQTHDFGSICIVTVMLNLSPYSVATHMICFTTKCLVHDFTAHGGETLPPSFNKANKTNQIACTS